MKHITYGDYSHILIKKIVCLKCQKLIKGFNLQLLLSQDECLCPACTPVQTETEKPNGTL